MSVQLTYSVRDLFATAADNRRGKPAALADYNVTCFRIAAYQRGYKWKAEGLVIKLLNDLREAYDAGQPDYYLQYLTVKRDEATQSLEVIDGQQRLTTLTLFFAVCAAAGWLSENQDFTCQKLDYAIRKHDGKSLLDRFIYQPAALRQLLPLEENKPNPTWAGFLATQPPKVQPAEVNRQDMFHLFEAAQRIHQFLALLPKDTRPGFINYVANSTRLIVNEVTRTTVSETVFHNLNDNRVELTDLDLVKGLLLTRATREAGASFQQLLEQRVAHGRQWDEMAAWLARPDVAAVLGVPVPAEEPAPKSGQPPKTGHPGLHLLVTLLVLRDKRWPHDGNSRPAPGRPFPLFAFLRGRLQGSATGKGRSARAVIRKLRKLYLVLRDWHEDPFMRNCLGVLQLSNGYQNTRDKKPHALLRNLTSRQSLKAGSARQTVRAAIHQLACLCPLPETSPAQATDPRSWPARYGSDNKAIQDLLLLLNVFPTEARREEGQAVPFDFAAYQQQGWSLEHIFPQNPDKTYQELPPADQKQLLQLVTRADRATVRALLAKTRRTEDEQAELKDLLKAAADKLNVLGNLVLLGSGENSALRNYSFNKKRTILAQKVQQGAFVPAHTFGVFAKLMPSTSAQLNLWGPDDMRAHENHLLDERLALLTYFSSTA